MAERMLSPSSINLYKQCPRKYYYQYILKLPTKPSIHLIRGSIVHEVLEKFFTLDISMLDKEEYRHGMRSYVMAYLLKLWRQNGPSLRALGLIQEQLDHYLIDSQEMLYNFVENFSEKLEHKLSSGKSFEQSFSELTPIVEEEIKNTELNVRGFIDAIHSEGSDITILDYKTSKKDDMTPGYRLQLSIYALLYKLKHGVLPKKVGINFLKFGEKSIDVDEELLSEAKREIELVHKLTESKHINDYPLNITPLCKWSTGQCDFYDACMKQRTLTQIQ